MLSHVNEAQCLLCLNVLDIGFHAALGLNHLTILWTHLYWIINKCIYFLMQFMFMFIFIFYMGGNRPFKSLKQTKITYATYFTHINISWQKSFFF